MKKTIILDLEHLAFVLFILLVFCIFIRCQTEPQQEKEYDYQEEKLIFQEQYESDTLEIEKK